MTENHEFLIIGAGISGASAAYELAAMGPTLLIEAETAPGYHSTGRSAALFTRHYGNAVVRRINAASHDFFTHPPDGFTQTPLLSPRGALSLASSEDRIALDGLLALSVPGHEIEEVSAARCAELAPLMRSERIMAGAYERGVMDIDVATLHQGFLRGLKQRGGAVLCKTRLERLEHRSGFWHAKIGEQILVARTLINAAGAWADEIGQMAGARPIGLVPKRRTAITVDAPAGFALESMPTIDILGHDAYLKPDAGRIMASPGDQTPVEPQDVQPEDFDIAVLVDWLETTTHLEVRRIASRWAGLRCFVADETPVVGFDDQVENFFWLAGQGGYGIMMAPALAKATASLIGHGQLPPALLDHGIRSFDLSPRRLG